MKLIVIFSSFKKFGNVARRSSNKHKSFAEEVKLPVRR